MKTALHENASVPVRHRDFCRSRLSGCGLACSIAWMVCRTEFPCSRCALSAGSQSVRRVLACHVGRIRRKLIAFAESRHRPDLAKVLQHTLDERQRRAGAVERAIETLRALPAPQPQISDDVEQWLAPRAAKALHAHGIRTLADLTVRIPRRRRWWAAIDGLGVAAARHIEAFFAAYPQLTERARA